MYVVEEPETIMRMRMLAVIAFVLALTAPVLAQQVYVNSAPGTDFSQYHTYAWGQQPNPNQIASPFLAQEAKKQIDAQLQGKGLSEVKEGDKPDLIVEASGGLKQETSYNAMSMGGWRFGGNTSITPQTSVVGTLVVDLYDAKAKQLVWRGIGTGTLNEGKSQKNYELVDKAVAKMFKKYP
jgi:Domain of unknown function (DUF4136)